MATAQANIQNKILKGKESSKKNSESSQEILDKNVSVEREIIKDEQIKLSSDEDLESLLKLAEDLKKNIDEVKNNPFIFRHRILQIILLTLCIVNIIYLLFYSSGMSSFEIKAILVFFTAAFSTITIIRSEYRLRTLKSRSLPDKLALKEVLQLLREVHGTIADREDWSILKRAEFRIRLSRFDLSEKKESVFSFFS